MSSETNEIDNQTGRQLLLQAVSRRDFSWVKKLLSMGVSPDPTEGDNFVCTPMEACFKHPWGFGQVHFHEIARELLAAGADINRLNKQGLTMLMQSCRYGDLRNVEFLLNAGADAKIKTARGTTAYRFAAAKKAKDVVKVMKALKLNDEMSEMLLKPDIEIEEAPRKRRM